MKSIIKPIICVAVLFCTVPLVAQTFEGKGAKSPEEAVTEYLNALKSCDYEKMISCYAVESYVENYDIEQHVLKLNCATPGMKMIYPKDNLLKQLAVYEVIDSITKTIKNQIWNLSQCDFLKDVKTLPVNDDIENVMKKMLPSDSEKKLSSIKFSNEFVSKENVLAYWMWEEDYDEADHEDAIKEIIERTKPQQDKLKKIYGCKKIEDVTAVFYIEENKYYLFAETIKYGNKWYISPNQGILASIAGINLGYGCIISEKEYH